MQSTTSSALPSQTPPPTHITLPSPTSTLRHPHIKTPLALGSKACPITIGATTLWDPWDAFLHLLRTWGQIVYLVPSNFCIWLSFLLEITLFNGWQMYAV